MVASLRLAVARAPRQYARTFATTAARAESQRNPVEDAVKQYNKSVSMSTPVQRAVGALTQIAV